jgi:hypothetical protein
VPNLAAKDRQLGRGCIQIRYVPYSHLAYYIYFPSGRTDASRRYLKEMPSPAFLSVKHEDFMNWLSNDERVTSDQFNRAEMDLVSSLNRRSQFFGAGDAFHVFPATSEVSSHDDSVDSTPRPHKRLRISEKDKPPCLRCRILKKKVSYTWVLSIKTSCNVPAPWMLRKFVDFHAKEILYLHSVWDIQDIVDR